MLKKFFALFMGIFVVLSLLAGTTQITLADGSPLKMHRQPNQNTRFSFKNMQIELPAGSSTDFTIEEGNSDLTGIKLPYGFRPISNVYKFGPHGIKFKNGKGPKISIKLDRVQLKQGDSIEQVKLYYINREQKRLQLVDNQEIDDIEGAINATLTHFSDYVPGITSSWDGTGLAPFADYISDGEEHVCVETNLTTVLSTVINLKGRGLDTKIDRVFAPDGLDPDDYMGTYLTNPLTIFQNWRWSLMCYYVDSSNVFSLYLPGGGRYFLGTVLSSFTLNGRKFNVYNSNGVIYAAPAKKPYDVVYLNDGTKMSLNGNVETITDPNGNQITIYFKNYYDSYTSTTTYQNDDGTWDIIENVTTITLPRIEKIIDSVNRTFLFRYSDNGNFFKLEQQLVNGSLKSILTPVGDGFMDALGRITTYFYQEDEPGAWINYNWTTRGISKIVYPNGSHSEYSVSIKNYGRIHVKTQKFFKPNENTPFRMVVYNYDNQYKASNTVNDGSKIMKYTLVFHHETLTETEETFELTKNFFTKRITYGYDFNLTRRTSIKTDYANTKGNIVSFATYTYSYDNWGNITKIIDPYGTETVMAYANTDSKKTISTKDCTGTRYVYDSDGNQMFLGYWEYHTPSDGANWSEYIYIPDENGQLIPLTETYTYQVQTGYKDVLYPTFTGTNPSVTIWNRLLTKATIVEDKIHNTKQLSQVQYEYDAKGNLLTESVFYNNGYLSTKYTYDQFGNVLTKTDANNNTLKFEYKSVSPYNSAFLTRVYKTDNSTISTIDYDTNIGTMTTVVDPKGNNFTYAYDNIGRVTEQRLNDNVVGTNSQVTYYDAESRLEIKYGSTSGGWQYGQIFYDPLVGKPIKIQRKINNIWQTIREFGYDSSSRLSWERDNSGHTTNYTYDALNRITQVKLPDSSITTMAWDLRELTVIDANGNQKTQKYDLLNRLTKVEEHPNINTLYTTSYSYDSTSNIIQVTNPRNSKTTFTYDNIGRITKLDYPQDGLNPMQPEAYSYDNVGNLVTKIVNNQTTSYQYEFYSGYRLKNITEPGSRTINYIYDPNNNITSQTASNGVSYSYIYDARNRVTNFTATLDGRNFLFNFNYDVFNRMTSITYPNRTNPVTYRYDELNRLVDMPGFINSTAYYPNNQLKEMVYANGVSNAYTYDVNGRITNINSGQGNLLNLNYSYDLVGNITQINNDYYAYDGMDRLTWYGNKPITQVASASGTRWTYDSAGNMSSREKLINGTSQGITSFSYDLANRLWSMGATSYDNDARGSRTQKRVNSDVLNYLYDGEARLSQVAKNGVTQVQNGYDGNGMRIKKVENGKTTYYLYKGSNPLIEYSANDGSYLYRIYAGNKAIAEEKSGVIKFYHKDHLGSTRVVTNASGAKIANYKFAPYGEKEVASDNGTEYGFTDKAGDDSTGLDYFGYRFYDPEVGRFINQDLIKSGNNWFSYCNNNPLRYIDPTGLYPDEGGGPSNNYGDVDHVSDHSIAGDGGSEGGSSDPHDNGGVLTGEDLERAINIFNENGFAEYDFNDNLREIDDLLENLGKGFGGSDGSIIGGDIFDFVINHISSQSLGELSLGNSYQFSNTGSTFAFNATSKTDENRDRFYTGVVTILGACALIVSAPVTVEVLVVASVTAAVGTVIAVDGLKSNK